VNLNQAKSLLLKAQEEINAARASEVTTKRHLEEARGRVAMVFGSGIKLEGLNDAMALLATLVQSSDQMTNAMNAADAKVKKASGS
jgi:hypothetical protein